MASSFDEILSALEDKNFDIDDAGISTDEEDDLDRQLATSDSDRRQVFICLRTDVVISFMVDRLNEFVGLCMLK
jgi:hypothetical protein